MYENKLYANIYTVECFISIKIEGTTCNSVDESQKHYTESKKPDAQLHVVELHYTV